jgi:hypothetical protein
MKEIASAAAVAITVFGTGPYAVAMLRGRIKPHAFTWLIWTSTTFIAFVGQLVGGGGVELQQQVPRRSSARSSVGMRSGAATVPTRGSTGCVSRVPRSPLSRGRSQEGRSLR